MTLTIGKTYQHNKRKWQKLTITGIRESDGKYLCHMDLGRNKKGEQLTNNTVLRAEYIVEHYNV